MAAERAGPPRSREGWLRLVWHDQWSNASPDRVRAVLRTLAASRHRPDEPVYGGDDGALQAFLDRVLPEDPASIVAMARVLSCFRHTRIGVLDQATAERLRDAFVAHWAEDPAAMLELFWRCMKAPRGAERLCTDPSVEAVYRALGEVPDVTLRALADRHWPRDLPVTSPLHVDVLRRKDLLKIPTVLRTVSTSWSSPDWDLLWPEVRQYGMWHLDRGTASSFARIARHCACDLRGWCLAQVVRTARADDPEVQLLIEALLSQGPDLNERVVRHLLNSRIDLHWARNRAYGPLARIYTEALRIWPHGRGRMFPRDAQVPFQGFWEWCREPRAIHVLGAVAMMHCDVAKTVVDWPPARDPIGEDDSLALSRVKTARARYLAITGLGRPDELLRQAVASDNRSIDLVTSAALLRSRIPFTLIRHGVCTLDNDEPRPELWDVPTANRAAMMVYALTSRPLQGARTVEVDLRMLRRLLEVLGRVPAAVRAAPQVDVVLRMVKRNVRGIHGLREVLGSGDPDWRGNLFEATNFPALHWVPLMRRPFMDAGRDRPEAPERLGAMEGHGALVVHAPEPADLVEPAEDLLHDGPPVASDSDAGACAVCLSNERDTVLVPCGHTLCRACAPRVDTCPVCRADVDRRVRFFA